MFKYYVISSISITFSFLEMKKTNAVTNNFLRIVCINNKNKSLFPGLYYYTMKERFNLFLIFLTETISRTDEGQPRPKYIFNKCGTNIYFFLLYRGLVHHHHRIWNSFFIFTLEEVKRLLKEFHVLPIYKKGPAGSQGSM